jgi:hypothetical protein
MGTWPGSIGGTAAGGARRARPENRPE